MTKTHFKDTTVGAVCGRVQGRMTDNVSRVDCLNCKGQPEWQEAYRAMKIQQEADYQAQTPRQVHNVWDWTKMYECRECGGDFFRERPRSLHSYHFVCSACGTAMFPPTETGMCQ